MLGRAWRRVRREVHEPADAYPWRLYVVLSAAGLTLLFLTDAPATSLRHSLFGVQYDFWRWMLTLAPLMCMVGHALQTTKEAYRGIWLQLIGHVSLTGLLVVYAMGAFETWRLAAFGGFLCAAVAADRTVALAARDLRRLITVERNL